MPQTNPTPGLSLRKVADTSEGTRVVRYDEVTGEARLVNPDTGVAEPWPTLGIEIVGDVLPSARVSTAILARGRQEGWVQFEGDVDVVHRPGGPPEDQWRVTHTFLHPEVVVLKCIGGDVRYRVVHQPDKYVDDSDPVEVKGRLAFPPPSVSPEADEREVTPEIYAAGQTRVDWFYDLELEG